MQLTVHSRDHPANGRAVRNLPASVPVQPQIAPAPVLKTRSRAHNGVITQPLLARRSATGEIDPCRRKGAIPSLANTVPRNKAIQQPRQGLNVSQGQIMVTRHDRARDTAPHLRIIETCRSAATLQMAVPWRSTSRGGRHERNRSSPGLSATDYAQQLNKRDNLAVGSLEE